MNEEWFGITTPTWCGGSINSLRPRQVYWQMRELWSGESADDATKSLFGDCAAVVTEKCVDMGNGGHGVLFDWVHNAPTLSDSTGNLACSGHGTCSTDWKQCGPGDFNTTSTPCCSCEPGFAGEGCEQLDARMYARLPTFTLVCSMLTTWHCVRPTNRYVSLGVGFVLAFLLLLMMAISIAKLLCARRAKVGLDDGSKPLLAFS